MSGSAAKSPQVFRAISRITAAFAKDGISKSHINVKDQYQYRSIDDVLGRLAPLLVKHGLCVLPRVLRREAEDRTGEAGAILVSVRLLVAYDLVSCRDGSRHTVRAWGEALDAGDKGTTKAMSAAYKSAMLQLFCVPVTSEDADASSHRLKPKIREREPVQGWSTWSEDILDIIGVCESMEALERVRSRQAALLEALRMERRELYDGIGRAFAARAEELSVRTATGATAPPAASSKSGAKAQGRKSGSAAATQTDHDAAAVSSKNSNQLEKIDG